MVGCCVSAHPPYQSVGRLAECRQASNQLVLLLLVQHVCPAGMNCVGGRRVGWGLSDQCGDLFEQRTIHNTQANSIHTCVRHPWLFTVVLVAGIVQGVKEGASHTSV